MVLFGATISGRLSMKWILRVRRMRASMRILNLSFAAIFLCASLVRSQDVAGPKSRADVIRHITIYESPSEYCAWPSIVRTLGGDLVVLFTRTDEHLGPDGAILLVRSTNNGKSWLQPVIVLDSPIDDRESGITSLRDGRIVGHFWSTFHTRESYESLQPNSYARDLLDEWIAIVARPGYRDGMKYSGAWTAVSSDGGRTWSKLNRGHDSVHGGIELANGSLLLASYRESPDSIKVHIADSASGPWRNLVTIATPHPESLSFCEPHMLQLKTGRVIMMIRSVTRPYNDRDPRCVLWESVLGRQREDVGGPLCDIALGISTAPGPPR